MKAVRKLAIAVGLGVMLGLGIIATGWTKRPSAVALDSSAVSSLPQRATSQPILRLASGLIPPTNRWFSSLVFSKTPQPIYAYPLSFKPTTTGFEVDAPIVTAAPNAVFGLHRPTLSFDVGASAGQVSGYDDLSAVYSQRRDDKEVVRSRITQGSPFIFVDSPAGTTIRLTSPNPPVSSGPNLWLINLADQTFGIYTKGSVTAVASGLTITLPADGGLTIFAMPQGADVSVYARAAANPITGTAVSYQVTPTQVQTTYELKTAAGSTLFAANPNLPLADAKTIPGSFTTLLGTQTVAEGSRFTTSQSAQPPAGQLDLSTLTAADRAIVIAQLRADADSLSFKATDTYFAGKELYRAANLLILANQLGETNVARNVQSKLRAELELWLDPTGSTKRANKYLYYDANYRGVVGETAAFGSEQFNDHHFHYGYIIYAAAALSRYDQAFYQSAAPIVNVLVADIAAPTTTANFPKLRVYDAYAGHSWASGSGDFADGNNQESSSEAINAWAAVYHWGKVSGNAGLAAQGQWLYQTESSVALRQWLTKPAAPAYSQTFVSLVWGGKLDFATFFSARPQDLFGIQLIPMSPAQRYLGRQPAARATAIINSVAPGGPSGAFSDYLVMYEALANPVAARTSLARLSPADIDSANSLAYAQAWVFSRSPRP